MLDQPNNKFWKDGMHVRRIWNMQGKERGKRDWKYARKREETEIENVPGEKKRKSCERRKERGKREGVWEAVSLTSNDGRKWDNRKRSQRLVRHTRVCIYILTFSKMHTHSRGTHMQHTHTDIDLCCWHGCVHRCTHRQLIKWKCCVDILSWEHVHVLIYNYTHTQGIYTYTGSNIQVFSRKILLCAL